jgi:hypothetical protein
MKSWMTLPGDHDPKPEGVRAWYDRTTRKWRKLLVVAVVGAVAISLLFYFGASKETHLTLQVFNGAIVIPVAAAIWIAAFVYIFLVPNREVGFRSQEAIERTVEILDNAVEKKLSPAVAAWTRIGERVEKELPALIQEAKETFAAARKISERLEKTASKNEELAAEAKPAIEALRKISERFGKELDSGLMEEARAAFTSIKSMAGVPKNPTEPDLGMALSSLRKKQ